MKRVLSVKEWLSMMTYIGHITIDYMYRVIADDSEWFSRVLKVNCVVCKINDEYCVVRLTDNQLEWEEDSTNLIGNTKVIINKTLYEYVDELVEDILCSDDLVETVLLEKNWRVEKVDF